MSTRKIFLKLSALLLLFSISFVSVGAATPKQPRAKKKTGTSAVVTQKVEAGQSVGSIEAAADDEIIPALPKGTQSPESEALLLNPLNDLMASADISKSIDAIRKYMIEHKEMQELSSELGVTIDDVSLLPLFREAASWLGTRYGRGGMSRAAVDCSGFTNIIYKNVFGIRLDRVSTAIAANVKESIYDKEDLQPGDMVFFSTFNKKYINHVGVYLGDGKFIHASIKYGVIVSSLAEGYYMKTWRKGGRNN
jgi:cell wall-associated NlpC family hydrolase